MKQMSFIALTLLLILTACTPTATEVPTPASVNTNPERGNAYLDSAELLIMESFPLQFTLALRGNLPTSCHELKVDVSLPDTENKILVDVYSLTQPDLICAQMLSPFEKNIPLGSFPAGHYFLWVNGELLTEFDA